MSHYFFVNGTDVYDLWFYSNRTTYCRDDSDWLSITEIVLDGSGNFVDAYLQVNLFKNNEFTITESIVSTDPDAVILFPI